MVVFIWGSRGELPCALPHQGVTASPSWAVIKHVLQGQGELQPLCLRDV